MTQERKEELLSKSKEELIDVIKDLENSNGFYLSKIKVYEQNGLAKLYYSLNRKMNEAADVLNENDLKNVRLNDKDDKSFERIVKILEASEKISVSATAIGKLAKVTGNEDEDVNNKPFVDSIAESRR